MESFSTNNYKKNNQKPNKKAKAFIIMFLLTFAGVMFVSLYLASIMTPNIDIPVLSNPDSESNSDVTSEDFKGRVDSRLRYIDMEDKSPSSRQYKANTQTEQTVQTVQPSQEEMPIDQQNINEDMTVENDVKPTQTVKPQDKTVQPKTTAAAPARNTQVRKPASVPTRGPIALRSKLNNSDSPRSTKVLVGRYSSPSEARQAASAFSDSNMTPFIKEHNGSYTLQVGSYSDSGKASDTANTLRNRGYNVQVVDD